MRSVLNITITQMVYREGHAKEINDNTCPAPEDFVDERLGFDWSEQLQGIILGAFFWGYVSISFEELVLFHLTLTLIGSDSRSGRCHFSEIWWKVYFELGNLVDSNLHIIDAHCHRMGYSH